MDYSLLDYSLDTSERLELVSNLPLHTYSQSQLEHIANYLLHYTKEKDTTQKFRKETSLPLTTDNPPTPTNYTKPKPHIHKENPYIQQYIQAVDTLKTLENNLPATHPDQWRLRKWRIEHNMDKGTANSLLYPTPHLNPTWTTLVLPPLDTLVDLTNSFHISKLLLHYSRLYADDEWRLWLNWISTEIIDKADLAPWQLHLITRRIDGVNQITIGRELGEFYGRVVTPSSISQNLRTIYRKIADRAKRLELQWEERNNPGAWRYCHSCKEHKLVVLDFYSSKPNTCKKCILEQRKK